MNIVAMSIKYIITCMNPTKLAVFIHNSHDIQLNHLSG